MEKPILNRLTKDFGDRGVRAAQFLKTAETLVASHPSAPRIGEVIAYCTREALVEIPRAAGVDEGQWKQLSRKVVEARMRYERARGLTGMAEQQALQDLLQSIDDLGPLHGRDSIHVEGLREIIRLRTGVDPLTHSSNALIEYQKLINDVNDMVHTPAGGNPVTVEAAGQCLQRAFDVLSRLFLVDPRMEQLQRLAALEQPTGVDVGPLSANLITSHDLRFFASSVISPVWLDLMLDHGLLELPEDPSEVWLATMMLSRLRDGHGKAIADWIEKAWVRWSATELGLIALATAAHQAGQNGREVLLRCLQRRSNVPVICRFARWELGDMDACDPHVESFADFLLNPTAPLDRYDKKDIPDKIVTGMNPANGLGRVTLLSHKLRAHIESEPSLYVDESVSIADPREEWPDDLVWTLLGALIKALRKAIDMKFSTGELLEPIKGLPQDVQDHIQAWLRTNAKDVECQEPIEFIAKAIPGRRPTGDDVLLVDMITDRCGLDTAVDVWQRALGLPPDPVALGTIIRQGSAPEDLMRRWFWSVVLPVEVARSWSESQAILDSALGRIERGDYLHPRHPVKLMSGPNSPFSTADLESKSPQEVAELIAAWKPTATDSWEMRSARGVGRQLEEIVKKNPRRWVDSPVEMVARLRHPTYVAYLFAGLTTGAEDLAEVGDRIIEAIDFARTHPWPAEPLGSDTFDADLDWNSTDSAGVDLIKALAAKHIPFGESADRRAWAIVIDAALDRGASSSILGDDTDALNSAINRPCTRALDTIVALIEYERRRSGVVPAEALAVLTESLEIEGRDGAEHRAILAPRIPFLRLALPEWFEENFELLLGSKAPPGLTQETIDLWLRWGRANEWMLTQFRGHILDSIRRGSVRALEGFLQGMFWDIPEYDAASCVRDLASLGSEHVSACGEAAARMVQAKDAEPQVVQRGIALWEEVLRTSRGREGLRGFGWWAEVPTIDADQWERLTLQTCEQAGGNIDWANNVAERASLRPASASALRILTLLVRAPLDYWESYRVAEHGLRALAQSSAESLVSNERDELRRALLDRGHFKAHDIK